MLFLSLKLIGTRQFLQIIIMFMIVQFFGLFLVAIQFNGISVSDITAANVVNTPITAIYFVIYIVIATAILLIVLKVYRNIFKLLELFVIFLTGFYFFIELFSPFEVSTTSLYIGMVVAGLLGITLILLKRKWPNLRNSVAIISAIGFGTILGIGFSFEIALAFMAIMAVYDFISVFVTKHMLTLANTAIENNLALLVDSTEVEAVPRSELSAEQLKEYEQNEKEASKKSKTHLFEVFDKQGYAEVPTSSALGTGDMIFPLMVAVSAFKVNYNFILPMFIVMGSIFGMLFTMFLLNRYKRALPAIPPLLFGILIFLLIYLLIF